MSQASPSTTPCRRVLAFSHLMEAVSEARELQDGYVRCGRWGLAQVCGHLTTFMTYSLEGFPGKNVPRPAAAVLRMALLNRWAMRRPMPAGMSAPAYLLPATLQEALPAAAGGAGEDDRRAVERFATACDRVERHAGAFRRSPLFGSVSPEKWRLVHRKHAAHHLGFLVPTVG